MCIRIGFVVVIGPSASRLWLLISPIRVYTYQFRCCYWSICITPMARNLAYSCVHISASLLLLVHEQEIVDQYCFNGSYTFSFLTLAYTYVYRSLKYILDLIYSDSGIHLFTYDTFIFHELIFRVFFDSSRSEVIIHCYQCFFLSIHL